LQWLPIGTFPPRAPHEALIVQSQTKKNLEAAFAGESMANRKYLYFARKRFAALSKIEKIHADRYQSFLDKRKESL
jgi:rubrerythrin